MLNKRAIARRRCLSYRPKQCAPFTSMAVIDDPERSRICTDNYFTFTFVRNPYERVLSAYLDKIGECREIDGEIKARVRPFSFYCEKIRAVLNIPTSRGVGFADFVRYLVHVKRTDPTERLFNAHWRSYRAHCATGSHSSAVSYDFVGRLEDDMDSNIERIFANLNISATHYARMRKNAGGAHDKLSKHYRAADREACRRIKANVYTVYQQDIDDFGYDFHVC